MNNMPMMTAEDKQGLINLHNLTSMLNPGASAQAMLHSLGRFLIDGTCTPDDAADIIKGVFDESVDKEISNMPIGNLLEEMLKD